MDQCEENRLYRDGEGDLFWLHRIESNGDWTGCWVRVDGHLVFKAARVAASFIEWAGMTPA